MNTNTNSHVGFRGLALLVGVLATVVTAMAVVRRRQERETAVPEFGGREEELGV